MQPLFITIHTLWQNWDALFFSEQSTLSICVFRLLAGVLVLLETHGWLHTYHTLLSPSGWFGYEDYQKNGRPIRFSLLNYLPPTTRSVEILLGLQIAAALCLTLGIFPQMAALVCFITLVSIHNRNMYALNSGDTVCRFFCLFLIFAPSGSQLSMLDAGHLLRPEATGWPWVILLLRFFIANIYAKNVLFKLLGQSWRDGTATRKVLQVKLWTRGKLPGWLDRDWFYKSTTYGTLILETALFTLIWIDPFRLPVLLAGVIFHLSLWYFLRVRLFQIAMIFGLSVFIEPEEYAAFFAWLMR